MAKKGKAEKTSDGKGLEQLKEEIAQKGKEIEQLQKSVEEMRTQIKGKEKTGETIELGKMVDDVSGLLNVGFSILGAPEKAQNEKSKGLVGLVDELGKLAEKSQTTQKTINFGKCGVIDFRVSSHPIKGTPATHHASTLKISRPNRETPKTQAPLPSTTGTIDGREPIVDVFEEEDCVRVIAELHGVEESEISLKVTDNALTISTDTSARKYYKEVELPTPIKEEITESSYRNGILEVKLVKTKKDT
jgi:HSP20 family protein